MASQRPETLPYLKTLPDPDSFDSLPRRWAESKIDELLRGSPLLNRARAAKEGVCKDYDAIKEAWNKTQEQKCAFPSFQEFSNMLAAVSSRAFGFGDSDEGVVMIPILDLCDHSRGRNHQKNLAYKRLQDGSVEVRSIVEIKQHELLRLTYGARERFVERLHLLIFLRTFLEQCLVLESLFLQLFHQVFEFFLCLAQRIYPCL